MKGRRRVLPLLLVAVVGCAPTDSAPDLGAHVAAVFDTRSAVGGEPIAGAAAAALHGRYVRPDGEVLEIFRGERELLLRTAGVAAAPVRNNGGWLEVSLAGADELTYETLLETEFGLEFQGHLWLPNVGNRPDSPPAEQARLLGLYESPADPEAGSKLMLLQWEGRYWLDVDGVLLIEAQISDDALDFGPNAAGLESARWTNEPEGVPGFVLDGITYRQTVGVRTGPTFRIEPALPIEDLRAAAAAGAPPEESGSEREPELVELVDVVADLRLEIRYASTDNFMGSVFYREPRAFMQHPAAEALARVQAALAADGFGLLIYDAYRPWFVTKMFWDATPESQKHFVADPSNGSRHNRGAAVDLTLVDLGTGEAVEMTGGYDEFTERSYPFYRGGTDRQRWHRELLRRAMEKADFRVYEYEWWHFDYADWPQYPILNDSFEDLEASR